MFLMILLAPYKANNELRTQSIIEKIETGLSVELNDLQIESVYSICRMWRRFDLLKNTDRLSYILATAWHESRLEPVKEKRFFKHQIRERANQDRYWLDGFYGRGFVQITWLKNYEKQGVKLGLPLAINPDLVLRVDVAAEILVRGMLDGDFTGKKLSRYINNKNTNYLWARWVVNGRDKRELIASYAYKIEL